MNKIRSRAQLHFPTVLLTLISIIQALALELLWSKIVDSDWLWQFDVQAFVGWGMIAAVLLGILQVWVMYSTMVMGFVWQPYLRDSIVPFFIGIQEFMLVTLIGEDFNTLWLYVLGSVFISANWVSHNSFRRARQDPENDEFFSKMEPATLRDYWPAMAIVTSLAVFGIAIDLSQNDSWLPLTALVFSNVILIYQTFNFRRLWRAIMGLNEEDAATNDAESASDDDKGAN